MGVTELFPNSSLAGPAGAHIHGQILTPFAVYCLVARAVSTVWFAAS